ncbi:hypothetical protein ACFTY8_02080 [Streptomyces mirabilis]|uniref:hypothetical protein n=1 Tax=Streptomyces mirabilis TaxID=68239 RepID=UPI00362BCD20
MAEVEAEVVGQVTDGCRAAVAARGGAAVPVDRRTGHGVEVPGSTRPTPILDRTHPNVTALVERTPTADTARDSLRVAHGIIAREVRPV